ncbi:MAG TPA: nickel-binding protein [Acidimicrobiales bacterium]|nr:nickel-binding protein [Acidimicrobiales bacterium]
MPEFLVEVYYPRSAPASTVPGPAEVAAAAEQLSKEGLAARLVRSLFVPDDETCFYLFQAESIEVVREAARRSQLRCDRVAEVGSDWTPSGIL